MGKFHLLDVREIPPWERHPKIFDLFDSLEVEDTIILVNDHDPRPLHYQFLAERSGQFDWHSLSRGEREWIAFIKRVAKATS